MNEIVNKFLSAFDKFMPEMHLRQPGLTYSAYAPFMKNKEIVKKFKEAEDSRYIYQNTLDKACFQHDMTYGDFKDLTRRTASDKIFHDKAFNIAKNPKYDGYQRRIVSIVYKYFVKKTFGTGIKNENLSNKDSQRYINQLLEKFKKRKVHPQLTNIVICGVDLADMQLISKFNKGVYFLLCVIDIFSKYAWVIPLKDYNAL